MRFITPEIAWHNRDPVYSLDIQPSLKITTCQPESAKSVPFLPGVNADTFLTLPALTYGAHPPKSVKSNRVETLTYRVASAGSDSTVVVWRAKVIFCSPAQKVKIDPVAQLTRHENAVNVVRFVPTGEDIIASASVDRSIIIWKRHDENSENILSSPKCSQANKSPPKLPPEQRISPSKQNDPAPMEVDDQEAKPVPRSVLKVTSKSGNRIALTTLSSSTSVNSQPESQPQSQPDPSFASGQELICEEQWTQWRLLRGHLEDVVDISWSSDGLFLLSGSVDNEAILWDVTKGTRIAFLSGHKGWVQGVAIDPLNNYLVTMSSDRIMRVFGFADRKIMHKVEKAPVSWIANSGGEDPEDLMSFIAATSSTPQRASPSATPCAQQFTSKLFYDYTMQSFARRLFFSPNGEFLLVPSGVVEFPKAEKDKKEPAEKDFLAKSDDANSPKIKSVKEAVPLRVSSPSVRKGRSKATTPTTAGSSNTPKSVKGRPNPQSTEAEAEAAPFDPGYINVCHVFERSNLTKPVAYLPLHDNYCHAVRFCPVKFALLSDEQKSSAAGEAHHPAKESTFSAFPLPYRLVFAIATHKSVLIYDTQHGTPIAYLNDIHYTRITDLAWSLDGRLLLISSTDGFVTFVTFDHSELGEVYTEPPPSQIVEGRTSQQDSSPTGNQPASQAGSQSTAQPSIRQLFAAIGRTSSSASPSAATNFPPSSNA